MPEAKHNRRKFLQRSFFALTGAAIGGTVAANQKGDDTLMVPEEQPIAPVVAPEQQLPFVRGLPEEVEALNKQHRANNPRPDLEHEGPRKGKAPKHTNLSADQERIVKGAVVGGVAGLAVHMGATISMKRSAEAGATQNDPERVEWERKQAIIRELEQRHKPNDRDL